MSLCELFCSLHYITSHLVDWSLVLSLWNSIFIWRVTGGTRQACALTQVIFQSLTHGPFSQCLVSIVFCLQKWGFPVGSLVVCKIYSLNLSRLRVLFPRDIISSVQFSHSVMSDSLRLHESQHTRPPCPSPTLRVYANLCPSSQWCHPAISSSVVPFSSCPQSFPALESFPMSHLFAWGGQSIGSFSFNIGPSDEHPGLISFRMDWLDLLAVQGTLKSLLQHHSSKASISSSQSNSHIHTWVLEKP